MAQAEEAATPSHDTHMAVLSIEQGMADSSDPAGCLLTCTAFYDKVASAKTMTCSSHRRPQKLHDLFIRHIPFYSFLFLVGTRLPLSSVLLALISGDSTRSAGVVLL
jgi:hypothetical protein